MRGYRLYRQGATDIVSISEGNELVIKVEYTPTLVTPAEIKAIQGYLRGLINDIEDMELLSAGWRKKE